MGAANVVPGVSGGTVAFITGIYERLINALKSFDVKAIKLLISFKIKEFIEYVDFWFLAALGGGVASRVLTLAKVLEIGFEKYPIYVASLFFGLILASIPSVGKMVRKWSTSRFIALIVGLAIALGLAFAPTANENTNLLYLMLCGVVAMCSMIIPGVSGSFMLILMGNYSLIMVASVSKLGDLNFSDSLPVLIPVGVGAVVGLLCLSRFLGWLFKAYHDGAVALITGFITGSLLLVWPWKTAISEDLGGGKVKVVAWDRYLPEINTSLGIAITIIIIGVALMLGVEKMGNSKGEK